MGDTDVSTPRMTAKTLMGSLSCLRRATHESIVEEDPKPKLAEVVAKDAIVLGLLADPERRDAIVRDSIYRVENIRFTKRPKVKAFSTKQDVALFAVDTARRLADTQIFRHAQPVGQKILRFEDVELYLPMDLYVPKGSNIYTLEVGSSANRLRGIALAMSLLKTAKEEVVYGGILRIGKDIETVKFDMAGIRDIANRAFGNIRLAFHHIKKGGRWDEIECRPTERTCAKCPLLNTESCPESTLMKITEL